MAVAWATGVNTNAYGMETSIKDNLKRIEFESGKERTFLKNSTPKKVFSFMLSLEDIGVNSEYKKFINWFCTTLQSGSNSFLFPNLVTHIGLAEYKLTAVPNISGQSPKEVSLSVMEM